ncbi:MAG: two-component system response regulator [Candidatus Saccharibacteria bacterium]|nr:two-component system response regulator [Candidatus Saccharibacteria bacterium]
MAGLPKILLVEDNYEISDIYKKVLTTQGFPLLHVRSVDELLKGIVAFAPDLIFLDIMLPGGQTGLDALKILRNNPEYNAIKTKIVLLTNLGESDEIKKMWEQYADGYIIKAEIDPHELMDVIKSLGFEINA